MARIKDITGYRFGKLLVSGLAHGDGKNAYWNCTCDCGGTCVTRADTLKGGRASSCGCLNRARMLEVRKVRPRFVKHDMSRSREYSTWAAMHQRCSNPKAYGWKYYGGKGIQVCAEWSTFEGFYADMGPRPEGQEIDRIDPAKGYSPDNCRWLPRLENSLRALQKGAA
jgi:hypothetical protein